MLSETTSATLWRLELGGKDQRRKNATLSKLAATLTTGHTVDRQNQRVTFLGGRVVFVGRCVRHLPKSVLHTS